MVAAARERCVDKIEQVEEIEYDEVVSLLIFQSTCNLLRVVKIKAD